MSQTSSLQNRFAPPPHRNSSSYSPPTTSPSTNNNDPKPPIETPPFPNLGPGSSEKNSPHNENGGQKPRIHWRTIHEDGESGRKGFHPKHFFHVCWKSSNHISMVTNLLWPVVPAAIAVHFALPNYHVLIFLLNYIAMIPAANTIGFAGQELARKLPKVFGVLVETTLGSLVEIILFIVLVVKGDQNIPVVRAAILGSILANQLLCMGLCFIAGGIRHSEQVFHETISEVGSNLMLVAGMALVTPAAFSTFVPSTSSSSGGTEGTTLSPRVQSDIVSISRATAVILLIAYCIYLYFQMSTHHNLITEVLEGDEANDRDHHLDISKKKLTFTECILALVIALTCVAMIATFLVLQIEYIVNEHGISDMFMGLILVPLVEKVAEHLTAIDEAWDNAANMALSHCLGASVQTALLNSSVAVIVGWGVSTQANGSGNHDIGMDLDFRSFEAIVLILAILVTGNFLRDGKSNYLEGSLCVLAYVIIAVCAWYYPNDAARSEGTG